MYIGIIAPTLARKHSPTKQRFELYHHVNTLTVTSTQIRQWTSNLVVDATSYHGNDYDGFGGDRTGNWKKRLMGDKRKDRKCLSKAVSQGITIPQSSQPTRCWAMVPLYHSVSDQPDPLALTDRVVFCYVYYVR